MPSPGPRAARVLKFVAAFLGVIFAGTLIYYGWRLYLNTSDMGQLSPAMQIPVAYIYLVIPLAACVHADPLPGGVQRARSRHQFYRCQH